MIYTAVIVVYRMNGRAPEPELFMKSPHCMEVLTGIIMNVLENAECIFSSQGFVEAAVVCSVERKFN